MLFVGRESQGRGRKWDLASFMPNIHIYYNGAFDPLSRHPIALQVSAYLLQQTTSTACLGRKLSGQLREICSGSKALSRYSSTIRRLSWLGTNPGITGLRCSGVLRF